MRWPFRRAPGPRDARPSGAGDNAKSSAYIARPIEQAIQESIAKDDNLVIFGPAHQGKTTLLNRYLSINDCIYIECRPSFKRTQIYRVALSSLGYSVLVEKKRRGKASTTVKLGVSPLGAEMSAEGELEQVMQSVSVDLKNPSEVAHLIARLKHRPWLVLDNFQLLDNATKRNLLFDLKFFTERPSIRMIIVGAWTNPDYLEEIEPAVVGCFTYVYVPAWSAAELRDAADQWAARALPPRAVSPHLEDYVSLAGGDIQLFHTLVQVAANMEDTAQGAPVSGETATGSTATDASAQLVQALVLNRFRRGLIGRLKAIFDQRETYLTYSAVQATRRFVNNPDFRRIPNATETSYLRTTINPATNQPYADRGSVLLDSDNNPQYLEQTVGEAKEMQTDIARFLFVSLQATVQEGNTRIELDRLVQDFATQLQPPPIAIDPSKLKAVFTQLDEIQRLALVIPPMLAVDGSGSAIEIVDRRLFLFLQSVSRADLEELLDDARPRSEPEARRRNHISPEMTDEEKAAYLAQAGLAMPDAQDVADDDGPSDEDLDEDGDEDDEDETSDEDGDEADEASTLPLS